MLQFGPHILGARLAVDTGDAGRSLTSAKNKTRGLKQEFGELKGRVKETTGLLSKLASVVGMAAGGGLAFSLGDAARQSIEFSGAMARVGTMLPANVSAMEKFGSTVRKVARQAGEDRAVIADALFNSLSASVAQDQAGAFLEDMSKAAVGGFTSVNTAVQGTTTVLNNWNLAATEGKRVTDAMFVANARGVTTFEQLATSVGTVAPAAAAMNISLEEVFATVASGSKSFTTATVMTSLRQALAAVAKPSKEASDLAQKLGIDFSEAGLQGMGFTAFLEELESKTGGSMAKLVTLFGSVEAAGLILRLVSKGGMKDFQDALKDMGSEVSATDAAYDKASRSMAFKTKRFVAEIKDTVLGVGMVLTEELFPDVGGMEDRFDGIREAAENMTRNIVRAIKAGLSTAADLFKFYLLGQIGGTLKVFGARMAAVGLASAAGGAAASGGIRPPIGPGGVGRVNQFSAAGSAAAAAALRQGQLFPEARASARSGLQSAARMGGRILGGLGSIAIYGQVAAMTIYGVHELTQYVAKQLDVGNHRGAARQNRANTQSFDFLNLLDHEALRSTFEEGGGPLNRFDTLEAGGGSRVGGLNLNEMMFALAAGQSNKLGGLMSAQGLEKLGVKEGEREVFAQALAKAFESNSGFQLALKQSRFGFDTDERHRAFNPDLPERVEGVNATKLMQNAIDDLPRVFDQAVKETMAVREKGEQAEALRLWAENLQDILARTPDAATSMFNSAVQTFQQAVDTQANAVLTIFHKIKDGKKKRRHGVRLTKRGLGAAKHLNPRYRLYVMRQGAGAWVVQPMPEDVTNVSVVNGGAT